MPTVSLTLPLHPFSGIPENLTIAGRHRAAVDPRLEIWVIPRGVEWKTGKFGYITKTPAKDRTEDLRYNSTRTPRFSSNCGKDISSERERESLKSVDRN